MSAKSGRIKKRVDARVKGALEKGLAENTRSLFVLIGKRGKSQIVNIHWLMTRCHESSAQGSQGSDKAVLWCYKEDLGFSPNHVGMALSVSMITVTTSTAYFHAE